MLKQEEVEEVWLKLKKYVEQSIVKKRIVWIEKKTGDADWWDKECIG